ncbi:hypothetical protein GLAREA_11442 [Glarea lozoyensis ATCC 20868]|uniref:Uncharacterized protein n=1 Tax=Glarea lozoyensis (strain ATCC 20868 / MF5171) TaxID=1116229 RepID=S3CYH2_GLAL2|nr:uncharacterized protein GLAREA_11442 [Glarea lozoyensis ATCC 20868]EPE24861.1 hypothetical protein GLAREA_11442 [Glarea lozoyensis ATCC 20868]
MHTISGSELWTVTKTDLKLQDRDVDVVVAIEGSETRGIEGRKVPSLRALKVRRGLEPRDEDDDNTFIRLKGTDTWFPYSVKDNKVKFNGKLVDIQDAFNVGDVKFGDVEFDHLFDVRIGDV